MGNGPRHGGYGRNLVKQRPGSDASILISLPNFTGSFPQHELRKHIPQFLYDLRASGNRISYPMNQFQSMFLTQNDVWIYSKALDWVFTRIEEYGTYSPMLNIAAPGNPMNDLWQDVDNALQYIQLVGTAPFDQYIEQALDLFKAIANIIQPVRGFNASTTLFQDYYEGARSFLKFFALVGPSEVFQLLQSVWLAAHENLIPIEGLVRSLSVPEEADLRQVVNFQANIIGDRLSMEMLQYGII